VARQQLHRELESTLFDWKYLFCGYCFRRHPGREAPVIGQGTGRRDLLEFRDVTWPHWPAGSGECDPDDLDFGASPDELLAMTTEVRTRTGLLRQVSKDAPRVSASKLRADVARRNPLAGVSKLHEIYEDELSRRRTSESPSRLSFEDVEDDRGRSALTCWGCGKSMSIDRVLLTRKITEALRTDQGVYISPWGIELR
jgi:hypothetical protein